MRPSFDPARAKAVADRLRTNAQLAMVGMPPIPAEPMFAGETRKLPGELVITNIGKEPQ